MCFTQTTAYSVSASVSATAATDLNTDPNRANWGIALTSAFASSSCASTVTTGAAVSACFFFGPVPRLGVGGASGVWSTALTSNALDAGPATYSLSERSSAPSGVSNPAWSV